MPKYKRKNRLVSSREPNGQIQRESDYSPVHVRRLKDAALRGVDDKRWASELGRYHLEHTITDEMAAAGRWWSEMANRYSQAIGLQKLAVRPLAWERGAISTEPDISQPNGTAIDKSDRKAIERFQKGYAVLQQAGMDAVRVVRNICEHD